MPSQIQRQLQKHCDEQAAHREQERREKARRAFEGTWIRATEVELKNCCDKHQSSSDPTFCADVKEWMKVLCYKLKMHHKSLGTFNTADAVQERIKVCTALGLQREEQQHLVTSVAERLLCCLGLSTVQRSREYSNMHMRRMGKEVFSSLLFRAQVVPLCLIQAWTTAQSLLHYFELAVPTRRSERGHPAVNEQSKSPRTF